MPEKSVTQKLLFKETYTVLLLNEPENYRKTLGALPAKVTILTEANGLVDLAQVFITSKKEMEAALKKLRTSLKPSALLWLTYPKGTSKVKADINRDIIREYVEANGFKTVALISVEDTWSALRLKMV
ncbi:MAG: hypothetical protein A2Z28_05695 [Chloroflexi bacterium RBG_16_51_9]|nr:MAG: hypothetical protein A2Z28_05695 [Chloroflexi bacterium RBG_16_51_9]